MIQHVSLTADEPQKAAGTIARLLGGLAVPFGPTKGAWSAVGPDRVGQIIEVMPRGSEFHNEEDQMTTRSGPPVRNSGFHVMVESPLNEAEVLEIASESGAPARVARHGPFDLIEFWLDGCMLIEVLTPDFARSYRKLLQSPEIASRFHDQRTA